MKQLLKVVDYYLHRTIMVIFPVEINISN